MSLTMRQAVDAYIAGRRSRGELSERSVHHLRSRLGLLLRSVGEDLPVAALDRGAILAWQEQVGGNRPSTRRSYLSSVKVFCQWLVAEGYLATDPTARVAKVREPRRVPRALGVGAVDQLLAACGGDLRRMAIVGLMLGCGLRCIEVSRLDVADYDRRERTVLVRGKAGDERMLPVPDETAQALEAYLESVGWAPGPLIRAPGRPSPVLGPWADLIRRWVCEDLALPPGQRRTSKAIWRSLVDDHGARISQSTVRDYVNVVKAERAAPAPVRVTPNWLSKELSDLMTAAGLKRARNDGVSAHALRHTAASDVLDRCHDVRIVQAMLGHASLATTEIYLRRANMGQLREAMAGRAYGVATENSPVGEGSAEMLATLRRLEELIGAMRSSATGYE